ncbi:MAG: hypothetical protein EAX90_04700 [Candidatus Heimdallarchaeota archaeon]|nr:hypothetical protein [Candidatus Heimdallarchaeota archaeon]
MSNANEKEAEIVKFPGIASISLSITPIGEFENFDLLEAVVRVYDENDEQIMRQKSRSLQTIAKNLKLFIQMRTNLPINDRRMAVWFADYLTKIDVKLEEEEAYQIIKTASQALEQVSRVKIELVEPSDLVSIETDVLARLISLQYDHLMSEDELYDLLEKNQSSASNKVIRTISYVNSGGVEHKDKITLEIVPSRNILEHNLIASFKNESEKDLTKVVISDIIPYSYKITEVTCKEGGKYSKELKEEGLKLSWKISKVAAGSEVKMLYSFERRIPRTIYIRKGEEIRIVQDYNSILVEETEKEKTSKYFISEVINLLPVTLDELIIRDLIPPEINLKEKCITDEMKFVDFGQTFGTNVQLTKVNVETGTKFLVRYDIENAPMIWKLDLNTIIDEEEKQEIKVTKIIEAIKNENTYICSIIVSSQIPCTVINEIEEGLKAIEFMPTELSPEGSEKEQKWSVENKFAVSMVLKGNLTRQPNPPKIKVENQEYVSKSEIGQTRKSKVIEIPFNHVALYRKTSRV